MTIGLLVINCTNKRYKSEEIKLKNKLTIKRHYLGKAEFLNEIQTFKQLQ